MIVRELMTVEPVTVRVGTTVKAALQLLDDNNITMLPVLCPDGRICGVVSEADLIRDVVGEDPRLHEIPPETHHADHQRFVDDVMTTHVVIVHPDTDLALAVELATSTSVKSLPVVDGDQRVVGVLSRRDVVHMLARTDELLETDVSALLASAGVRDWLVDVHEGVAGISGPSDSAERALARVLATSVPGVVDVEID